MVSITLKSINTCWELDEPVSGKVVKACSINLNNGGNENGSAVLVTAPMKKESKMFNHMMFKKCDPKKDKCEINVGNGFYNQCDPETDDKCNVDLNDLLFPF